MPQRSLTPHNGSRDLMPFAADPFSAFRREMDRLFDDFFAPSAHRMAGESAVLSPSIDVHEMDDAYVVTAELPGMEAKDVELNLRDNALTLTGEKREEKTMGEGDRTWSERSYGRFQRTIPFDTEVDADKVEANCRNGVLTVNLPKNVAAHDKTRKIEIKPN